MNIRWSWCTTYSPFALQGSGYGKIHLQLTYLSLSELRSDRVQIETEPNELETAEFRGVQRGLVFILVERGHNLTSGDGGGKTDPYCVLWLGGVKKRTEPQKDNCDPVWNENLDWPNISSMDSLYLEVSPIDKYTSALLYLIIFSEEYRCCKIAFSAIWKNIGMH